MDEAARAREEDADVPMLGLLLFLFLLSSSVLLWTLAADIEGLMFALLDLCFTYSDCSTDYWKLV